VETKTRSAVEISLACPICGGNLNPLPDQVTCEKCRHAFPVDGGIPQFFWQNDWPADKPDVTRAMQAFYEKTPFPNYDDFDSAEALRLKARRGVFAKLLDEQIRHGSTILEVGCGTGQLSNFLGMTWGRTVYGADGCLHSLQLAENFRRENEIKGAKFLQMNLFRPVFPEESFDFVVCNGVLHHTSDPYLGFQTIGKLVKRGGFILIGLYNKYSRLATDFRRWMFRVSGDRMQFLDPQIRDRAANQGRKQAWFLDQYKNPHESKHTFGEVQGWFNENGFEFMNSIPKAQGESFATDEKLFEPHAPGTALNHFLVQAGEMLVGGRDGGFFIMIGKRL
jgi:2-polyprenyl-3-methyl-5-hydroxy-6-metoxy-1,4-benzoquinol methylase